MNFCDKQSSEEPEGKYAMSSMKPCWDRPRSIYSNGGPSRGQRLDATQLLLWDNTWAKNTTFLCTLQTQKQCRIIPRPGFVPEARRRDRQIALRDSVGFGTGFDWANKLPLVLAIDVPDVVSSLMVETREPGTERPITKCSPWIVECFWMFPVLPEVVWGHWTYSRYPGLVCGV